MAVVLLAPAAGAQAPPAERPTYQIGDRWIRSDGAYDLVRIENDQYIFAAGTGREIRLTRDLAIAMVRRGERVKWALGTFLGRSAQKDDTVLIFFAGHGAPEVDTRGMERDGLAKYLIPADADPDDLDSSALPMDELQTIFSRIEAERVVAFLDACYSGGAGGRTFTSKKTRAGSVDDLFLERLTRSRGRAIVTASRTNEVSLELPDLAVGGNQHPVMKGELEGALPLAKVRR
ncbi:MAG: caspase family protein [Candidatus Rokuibacteriota bacterium]